MSCEFGLLRAAGIVGLVAASVAGCKGGSGGGGAPAATGGAAASADTRTAVPLPADGQQAVLREMRQMLGAMGGAMAAAAKGDTAAVVSSLAPAGTAAAADPALESMLPPAWKELAERTHGGFDRLSAAVRRTGGGPALRDTVLVGLAQISGSCTACHESFRVTVR